MFEKETKLIIADVGTSKTDIAVKPHFNEVYTYPTLVAYNDQGTVIGTDAIELAGTADLIWVKDAARLSKSELRKHPDAFTDFVRESLNRIGIDPPIDLMLSEPALMTQFARTQILEQLGAISGIKRAYFLPELIGTVFSENITGRFIILDMGDGNTSVQGFNNRAPIRGAQQTFRAGRTLTYRTAEVIREHYDVDYNVTDAGSRDYTYMISLKERILSGETQIKIIDNHNEIQIVTVTPKIQSEIVNCLFDDGQYKAVDRIVRDVAFSVKDLARDLLSRIYVTGRTFNSPVILRLFEAEINKLLQDEKNALEIQRIGVTRVQQNAQSVIEGMKVLGEKVQQGSKQWIDLDEYR